MLEVAHPELTVDRLVAHMNGQPLPSEFGGDHANGKDRAATDGTAEYAWDQLAAHCRRAEQHAFVGRSVPRFSHCAWPKRRLARWVARAVIYVARVVTKGQREFNVAILHGIRDLATTVRRLDEARRGTVCHLQQFLEGRLETQARTVRDLQEALERQQAVVRAQEASIRSLRAAVSNLELSVQRQERTQQAQREALDRLDAARPDQQGRIEVQEAHSRALQESLRGLETAVRDQAGQAENLKTALGRVQTGLLVQDARVRSFVEEARRRLPEPLQPDQVRSLAAAAEYSLEALYLAFEDQFRGSRQEIKSRLRVYLTRVSEAAAGAEVLDLGCGRGEWLELLEEEGVRGCGVDVNRAMTDECRRRGFRVIEADALTYLRSLPDACLGAVTAFHLIEHMPWHAFLTLLDETVRTLKPGGLAIFESPNPENLSVGSCTFWADPTHRRPLFPPTVQFLAEQRGLIGVEVWRVNRRAADDPLRGLPADHPLADWFNPLVEVARHRFFSAPDFAVLGSKVR
jgi:O-antigen chain-terminating methyltransferase